MNRARSWIAASVAATALVSSASARADVSPFCNEFDSRVTCGAAQVGQACAGGGTCAAVSCEGVGSTNFETIYKCVSCPSAIVDPANVCEPGTSAFNKPCGDGGTCMRFPSYCPRGSGYMTCGTAAPVLDAGPPAANPPPDGGGSADTTKSNGCTSSPVARRTGFATLLLLASALALLAGRRPKS